MNTEKVRPFTLADADTQQAAPPVPLAQKWPELTPLDAGQSLCDFPEDWGPAPLRDYAAACAASSQTLPCLNIAAVLAAAAIAAQGKFAVQAGSGYEEPLNLFLAVVAPSGERKSAVLRNATRFLQAYETEEMHRPEKGFERLICDDLAPDDLVSVLARSSGRVGLISNTGGVFGSIRRYRDAGTAIFDVYARAYDGAPVRTERRGGGEVSAPHPSLTMLLEAVPLLPMSFIHGRNPKARDFSAHVLYAVVNASNTLSGKRKATAPDIPVSIAEAYEAALRRLLDYRPAKAQALMLSDDAEACRAQFFDWLEPQLAGPLLPLGNWASKLSGTVCRIAGILHCFTEDEPAAQPISGLTMARAASLGRCFLQHAQVLYGASGEKRTIEDAAYVLQKVAGLEQITRRDLYRACRSRFKKANDMEPVIQLLCEHGYLVETVKQPPGGHRSSVVLFVNPQVTQNK